MKIYIKTLGRNTKTTIMNTLNSHTDSSSTFFFIIAFFSVGFPPTIQVFNVLLMLKIYIYVQK